jgi:hypothetical protein
MLSTIRLQVGTVVQVKSEHEILALLDEKGYFQGLPFTQEMRKFCGTTWSVRTVVNRLHIEGVGISGMNDTVILQGAQCDGTAHGMCDRACFLLFKRAWLSILPRDLNSGKSSVTHDNLCVDPLFWKDGTQRCQGDSTVLVKATSYLSPLDMRQYIHDLKTKTWRVRDVAFMLLFLLNRKWEATESVWDVSLGNRTFGDMCRMARIVLGQNMRWYLDRLLKAGNEDQKSRSVLKRDSVEAMRVKGEQNPGKKSSEPLNLQPGKWVQVKSRNEILMTLGERQRYKGLGFSGGMLKHCGKRFQVLGHITNLVDEKTGRQIKNIKDTVVLKDCLCTGISFRGCPRGCYWFWKVDWLKRVDDRVNQK